MNQDDAKRFREQAGECRREAEKANSQDAAEAWLRLGALEPPLAPALIIGIEHLEHHNEHAGAAGARSLR